MSATRSHFPFKHDTKFEKSFFCSHIKPCPGEPRLILIENTADPDQLVSDETI